MCIRDSHDTDSTYYKPSAAKGDNITSDLVTALDSVSEGKAAVASTSNALYVICKLSIDDAYTDEVEASDSRYISLLSELQGLGNLLLSLIHIFMSPELILST